jgi:hypothetical protein
LAGASFAKDVQKVQGMEALTRSGQRKSLAMRLLDQSIAAEFRAGIEDPAYMLMSGWLLESWDNLPEVLARWRQAGLRLARSKGIAPSHPEPEGIGRTVAKNDACPCGSGRKARRCHPAGLPAANQLGE